MEDISTGFQATFQNKRELLSILQGARDEKFGVSPGSAEAPGGPRAESIEVGARTNGTDSYYREGQNEPAKRKRNELILGGVALLLVIDLLFLPWFDIGIGPFSVTSTATGAPDGWLGILAVLAAWHCSQISGSNGSRRRRECRRSAPAGR